MSEHYKVLASCPAQPVYDLAARVLETFPASQIRLLSGPRQGLVMLRVRETVENSQFNAGEVLVTEVRLELDGQFGFGMVLGDQPRRAMAVALIDAALQKGGVLSGQLQTEVARLAAQLDQTHRRQYEQVALTKIAFETM